MTVRRYVADEAERRNLMELLEESRREERPRLFAIYGLRRDRSATEIMGWGMEFDFDRGVIFRDPCVQRTMLAASAEEIRDRLATTSDVHLVWLGRTPPATPGE
jgi:hypothetical protein